MSRKVNMNDPSYEYWKGTNFSRKQCEVFVLKADQGTGVVEAIVNVYGIVDHGTDVVEYGAATKTIQERPRAIRVLDNHNTFSVLDTIGTCLEIKEISRVELPAEVLAKYPEATGGLWTKTQFLMETPEGAGAYIRLVAKAISEFSIGFDIIKAEREKRMWRGEEKTVRVIKEIRLWEYSAVLWGQNPGTTPTSIMGASSSKEYDGTRPVVRIGDYLQASMVAAFFHCLTWMFKEGYFDASEFNTLVTLFQTTSLGFRTAIPDDIALREIGYYGDYLWYSNALVTEIKAGRVLSGANATKLTNALNIINEVLTSAGVIQDPGEIVPVDEDADKSDSLETDPDQPEAEPQLALTDNQRALELFRVRQAEFEISLMEIQ